MQNYHIPVLLQQVLTYLDPKSGESYLDLTAGYGGHAAAIVEKTHAPHKAVLVDRDINAVNSLREKFGDVGVTIIHKDYRQATRQLLSEARTFDVILADLGVSSPHLDIASRGFSFRADGPLDMRMDQTQELTAADIVNTYDAGSLIDILRRFGEEPRANKIARVIIEHRPILTTKQLATVVAEASPGYSKIDPATKTFQALRIAVNDELKQLDESLPDWINLLNPNGRIAVISFQSLEDRIVKKAFAEHGGNRYDATLTILTKQPIMADENELVSNPRARSAKLRAALKK